VLFVVHQDPAIQKTDQRRRKRNSQGGGWLTLTIYDDTENKKTYVGFYRSDKTFYETISLDDLPLLEGLSING
jgi:hypothetical protein